MAPKKRSTTKKKAPARKASAQKKAPAKETLVQKEADFFIKNIEKFEHSIDFDLVRGGFAALAFMIVSQLVHMIGAWTTMPFYTDANYMVLWSKIMMPVPGAPPLSFTIYSMIGAFFVGFLYTFFYHMVRVSLHGHAPHKPWVKGLLYGIFLVFIVAIPMMIQQFLILNLPIGVIVAWFAENVLIYLLGGTAIATIMK